jgi:cyclic pyranopterin phosphate synthase
MAVFLTTNASLLDRYASELSEVPLSGMNVSVDTADARKFREITRVGDIADVKAGIEEALRAGIPNIKTNTVLIRGFNDGELADILRFARDNGVTPRFIEFMPLGDDVWRREKFIAAGEILRILAKYGEWLPLEKQASGTGDLPAGPAKYYADAATGSVVGVIEAVSDHFCSSCNRLRVTASGNLRACLFSREEAPLLPLIRSGDLDGLKLAILEGMDAKPECWENLRDGKQRMSGIGG